MIKNEREYRITKTQVERFKQALAQYEATPPDPDLHPLFRQAQLDGMRSQLDELHEEVAEYETLRAGSRAVVELDSLAALPRALIQARIASGMTQRELGERLGLKEQQIQRYEATEYASASFDRLTAIANALGVVIHEDVFIPTPHFSVEELINQVRSLGVSREFILARMIPPTVRAQIEASVDSGTSALVQFATYVSRIFGMTAKDLLTSPTSVIGSMAFTAARYKLPSRVSERQLSVYTVYAQYLALLTLSITPDPGHVEFPEDSNEFREQVLQRYGSISFQHVLSFAWDCGIPVLPLDDPGTFHAACWKIGGRYVIVLKQRNHSPSRWLFDLLHELYHCTQRRELLDWAIIEEDDDAQDEEEEAASQFAGDVILNGRAEELATLCVRGAGKSVERLKSVVPQVATRANAPIDGLANYMAFRLSLQGINWWGAANNLQTHDIEPWECARDVYIQRVQFKLLNDIDRNLLQRALSRWEG